jgi:hypothetical protein
MIITIVALLSLLFVAVFASQDCEGLFVVVVVVKSIKLSLTQTTL